MTNEQPLGVCLCLGGPTDGQSQEPVLHRADLRCLCKRCAWEVVQVYQVDRSAFGETDRDRFYALLQRVRRGTFYILAVWSINGLSCEGEESVLRIFEVILDWHVQFCSCSEPFLDTTGPDARRSIPVFAWLAQRKNVRKCKALRLGMHAVKTKGKPVGRPAAVDRVDAELMKDLRARATAGEKSPTYIHRLRPLVGEP